jgi:hypothetical protein
MKKTALVLVLFASLFAMSFRLTQKPEDPIYKNLKVLPKKITKQQLDSVMKHFTVALNVKCNFCHMRNDSTKAWDFASDANKHKLKAREMLKMTQKINDKFFDVAGTKGLNAKLMVTCYTCHNGHAEPRVAPSMTDERQGNGRPNSGDSTRWKQRMDSTRRQ